MPARDWASIRQQMISVFNPIVQGQFGANPTSAQQATINELLIKSNDSSLIAQSRIALFNQLFPWVNLPYALVPDAWQVRVEGNRPQLVFSFYSLDSNGNVLTLTDNELTIAHPIPQKPTVSSIPVHTKGDYISYNVYSDNSKLIINCATADQAQQVRDACIQLIQPSYASTIIQSPIKPRQTTNNITQVTVRPARAAYFSQGQKNTKPDWVVQF